MRQLFRWMQANKNTIFECKLFVIHWRNAHIEFYKSTKNVRVDKVEKKIQDRLQLTRNNWIKFLDCEIWTRRVRTRTSQFIGSVRTKNTMFSTIVWDETRTSIVERVKSTELVPFQAILWWYSHTHTNSQQKPNTIVQAQAKHVIIAFDWFQTNYCY